METLKQHFLSSAFPSMDEADFLRLVDNIDDHGQRDPITICENAILDGWHRYRACMMIGVEPKIVQFDGDDPAAFVISRNLHRRHLTAGQRATAVVACNTWAPSQRPGGIALNQTPGVHLPATNADMAKLAQVHPTTIKYAKAAYTAGFGEAIKDGTISVKAAAAIARGTAARPAGGGSSTSKPDAPEVSGSSTTAPPDADRPEAVKTAKEVLAAKLAEEAHGESDLGMLVDELTAENKALQAQVDAANADDVKAEVIKYQRIASVAQGRQNELMATVNDREQHLKRLMAIVRRCGRAVGEDDPYKVAPAVEAAMLRVAPELV